MISTQVIETNRQQPHPSVPMVLAVAPVHRRCSDYFAPVAVAVAVVLVSGFLRPT